MDIALYKNESPSGVETINQTYHDSHYHYHFKRLRLNQLFMEAANFPLAVVCAGAGYGKTSAVYDFVQEYQARTAWIQLSERDNVSARFWENLTHTAYQVNMPLAMAMGNLGFPDSQDKLIQFKNLYHKFVMPERKIIVFDDFHFLEDPSVIRFLERAMQGSLAGSLIIIISRSTPRINTAGLVSRGQMFSMNENDLRFTEDELAQYFRRLNITTQPENLHEIMQDTEGWAFAINLIARSFQKAPGYEGYLRNAMKANIFRLMEMEIWDWISERIQSFLVRLSLIDHLSFDLIELLAEGDSSLISELDRQNAYIRRDHFINAYVIHPLLLEFLATKQEFLSEDEKQKTYRIAGAWCNNNGFKMDAISYYAKTGDYSSIVSIFFELPAEIPYDIAKYTASILDQTPEEKFLEVDSLAIMHLRSYMSLGNLQKSIKLASYYEKKFLELPQDSDFTKHSLCGLYYYWGYLSGLVGLTSDIYEFDFYFEKFCRYLTPSFNHSRLKNYYPGPWNNITGSSRKGAPQGYIDAKVRASIVIAKYLNGYQNGDTELCMGELKFYEGDLLAAETFMTRALEISRAAGQPELIHRELLYMLRLNFARGNFLKAEQALKEIKAQLEDEGYTNRFINYDISLSWYYCMLGFPEKTSDWLQQSFSPYSYAGFIENFGNQIKARYCYLTRNYPPLLAYIGEIREKASFLYGRIEMLAMEACVYYKLKDKSRAFSVLTEAYETAAPNELLMPFIELGKDMRTLCSVALKNQNIKIPKSWLENMGRKAASYAKHQTHVATEYRRANRLVNTITFSPREAEVFGDLTHGLSRVEIANNRTLSINTVKMVINSIYSKTGAGNLADLIRFAVERKMF